ncbi:MAG: cysteine--tRNA ligase [Clostridia bacterium]|nr:cysteine--tRNA ligase [Clostridia bacterium]
MLKLYNTLTRQKEDFKPLEENTVRMYTCGLTVYSEAHIGNMRAYLFMDNLRKVLKYNDYNLNHVMNITDVGHMTSDADEGEDKMEKAARKANKNPLDIAHEITEKFLNDFDRLNIERPEHITPATEHIKDMEEYVAKIMENGYAYETSKGIYFDTSKLKSYGELSRANLEKQLAGARIEVDSEKRNPLDFALWIKAPKEHIMKWNSRWGECYPGWHIECSAMGHKYLGTKFDIHTGGVDHIPIHHENEIAQAKGAYGINPANLWMHVEFLLIDGGKMSKSLGNCYTISTLVEKGYEPLAYRYFTYTSHYRNKLNFTWESIDSAQKSLLRLREAYFNHENGTEDVSEELLNEWKEEFKSAINDDLNFPLAMATVWEVAKFAKHSKKIAKLLLDFDSVLSLSIDKKEEKTLLLDKEIEELLEKRKAARENKDFKTSDEIRDLLLQKGYKVIDTKTGQQIEKV